MGSKANGKITVVDFDDLCDDNDPLITLLQLKERVPTFNCTLFAIPTRCSDELLKAYDEHASWISLGVHGWRHARHECLAWTSEELYNPNPADGPPGKLQLAMQIYPSFAKVFKAPNWEYDKEVYEGCRQAGFAVADHIRNIEILPDGLPHYIYNIKLRNDAYRRHHGHIQDWNGTGLREAFDKYAALPGPFAFIHEITTTQKELAV